MKRTLTVIAAAAALLATSLVMAASANTSGEVRRIDAAAGKITIKHGAISNLDLPAMTLVFHVADPAMLQNVKPGDKVRFAADKINGQYTITALER
ncbi:copper-binding protein [Pigmentiphaga litoralis]|jgi:Cu(I)/Ag(I) efflux system protein CusF|uniref:Cu/Ag efflux protein CusF n=1 Tax=Pigmentiphaga litoralis TaxID=516702 RepID=A0A7Y9IRA9_9BURK|nr:copper-binding protein [Pigmentiphaga litoralis]NYE24751.1 Cu/Ag efflux protein CusF [Pigmentiphaga litoralis]NYE81635.1 Cu/Ag efflux protein CusF [Pigmentiphaga litoralis]